MRKVVMPIVLVLILSLFIYNRDNNQTIHQSISFKKIEEIVVFQEFYKVEPGGVGVTIEHLDYRLKPTEKEGKQLLQWFNSISDEKVLREAKLPHTLAGVSFEMKFNKRKVVHYHEGIFYVSTKDDIYSFVHNDMKDYFEKILKVN